MPSKYLNISEKEMTSFLTERGFKLVKLSNVSEKVFAKRVDQDGMQLSLRIFTGIFSGESRECGKDAIRVSLFFRSEEGIVTLASVAKRVHRVHGWKKNLDSRIRDFLTAKIRRCRACENGIMVPRKGKNGEFAGCSNYPNCKHTEAQ